MVLIVSDTMSDSYYFKGRDHLFPVPRVSNVFAKIQIIGSSEK